MHRKRELLFIFMPLIMGTIIAEVMILFTGEKNVMDIGFEIIIGLIAVLFPVLALLIALKRDGSKG